MFTLQAEPRSTGYKAKHLRQRGLIPGCLYGGGMDESRLLQIEQSEVIKLLKSKARGGIVSLDVEGEKINALLRDICRSPVNGRIEHLSFQRLKGSEPVTSIAQITLINKDKIPVYIKQALFDIPYRAAAANLTEKIEVNLDGMHAGSCLKVKDLDIAHNGDIELLIDPESLVVSIIENKKAAYMMQAAKTNL